MSDVEHIPLRPRKRRRHIAVPEISYDLARIICGHASVDRGLPTPSVQRLQLHRPIAPAEAMPSVSVARCPICLTTAEVTREHVWPRWFLKRIDAAGPHRLAGRSTAFRSRIAPGTRSRESAGSG